MTTTTCSQSLLLLEDEQDWSSFVVVTSGDTTYAPKTTPICERHDGAMAVTIANDTATLLWYRLGAEMSAFGVVASGDDNLYEREGGDGVFVDRSSS